MLKTRVFTRLSQALVVAAVSCVPVSAAIITIDFEGIADGTNIAATYSGQGATFGNASVITAGISLNELEFPPHSGQNVATDSGGPVTIAFTTPVSAFSGFFTYGSALTLTAYDILNNQVASSSSAFNQNYVSSGNPANELLSLNFASGIDHVTLTGDPSGGSFVLDDISFNTTISTTQTPEPSTFILFSGALVLIISRNRKYFVTNSRFKS